MKLPAKNIKVNIDKRLLGIKSRKIKGIKGCAGEVTVKMRKGFRVEPTLKILEMEKDNDGVTVIKKAELVEVSLVFDEGKEKKIRKKVKKND